MAHNQSDDTKADPEKFGLKFDSGKPRWELLPIEIVREIIRVPAALIDKTIEGADSLNLLEFDKSRIINTVMDLIAAWREGGKLFSGHHRLAIAAFTVFYLLRGKPYSKEEIQSKEVHRWDLFNMEDLEGVVDVYTMGAKKYADNNWQKVSADRYFGALMRHFLTIHTVNRYDSELGCLHMHQVIWNMIALMWLEKNGKGQFTTDVTEKPDDDQRCEKCIIDE